MTDGVTGKAQLSAALTQLEQLLGPRGFSADPADLKPWLTDWRGRFTGRTLAILSPATTQEVSAIIRICAAYGLPVVPQGGNSGMVGGATPDTSGHSILLSMRRMNAITEINAGDGLVRAQAGVILQNLHEAVEAHGQRFPLTLGGKGSATVGGLISTNAGGTQVLRHGTMRALVDGLEAVLADGSVLNLLAPLKKDNRGYDLRHLLIGAEGTLGIVTAATLRTVPALISRAVVWAAVAGPQDAYRLLRFIETQCGNRLEGFELVDNRGLSAVLRHIPGTRPPLEGEHPWHVLAEFVQDNAGQEAPDALATRIFADAMAAGLIADAAISANEAQAEAFWKLRDSIAEAERADGPALQHDISVPVADMARFVESAASAVEARFAGTQVVAFGHLGDGNVHFHVKAPAGVDADQWYDAQSKPISSFVYDLVNQYGGSISAEHGIGQMKREELLRLSDPARIAMLKAIKQAVDPLNILNPGKIVSLAEKGMGT